MERELTTKEKREIKVLVTGLCINYDKTIGCLLLEDDCPMLLKCYNNCCVCRYFRESVLPSNPVLEAVFATGVLKVCKNCGKKFKGRPRKSCCSEKCTKELANKRTKQRVRKQRQKQAGCVTFLGFEPVDFQRVQRPVLKGRCTYIQTPKNKGLSVTKHKRKYMIGSRFK